MASANLIATIKAGSSYKQNTNLFPNPIKITENGTVRIAVCLQNLGRIIVVINGYDCTINDYKKIQAGELAIIDVPVGAGDTINLKTDAQPGTLMCCRLLHLKGAI